MGILGKEKLGIGLGICFAFLARIIQSLGRPKRDSHIFADALPTIVLRWCPRRTFG